MTIASMLGGTMLLVLILLVVLIVLLFAALFIVPQQQAYIIERFGKFLKVQFAGIHIRIPFVDRIAMKTNMRVNQLNVQLETKTLDNVFVTVVASTQFRVNPNDVATAYYELRDPAGQLRSYMEDALRSAIPALTLDDAFARKDDVAFDVQKTVGAEMSRFGFTASVPKPSASRSRHRPPPKPRRPVCRARARPTTAVKSPMASSIRSRVCRPWAWTSTM